ncbi:Anthranilate synthase component II protein [Halorhabdus tiamatea SARL4B]|uniref:Anthranilate synthase component II n=1 Tax=Halorhabdus tiamatea SARL4B TaxID=1033806 RepID=F7PQI8_9EURY|nr:anthranilate synthase component II [Halorhabdus tiamatea]ERJ04875.1 Anthranilate synthase component II protein [Halorhabdus tiamatea SARL4B]CCQ33316.1 glutamine amidotransferase of anthranilate synthase [Halorhabdus tiamatea SARL4B]
MSESAATVDGDATTETPTDDLEVLFVDNFDSFTYNLVEYTSEHADTTVVKNTASLSDVRAADPDAIIISPGPGHPRNDRDVGVSTDVLRKISPDVPTLGVCLGLEAAVYEYGGTVGHAPEPIHGKAAAIDHDSEGVFAGLDQGFQGGRYHSLIASDVPNCFEITATTEADDGTELVMGIRHRKHPIEAVQFHPESVLTAVGHDVIRNFLASV